MLLAILVCCAVLPYACMVWRSHQDIQINFYGSIDALRAFWFYFSRQGYIEVDISPSAGWLDRFRFMQWLGNEFLLQLTLQGLVYGERLFNPFMSTKKRNEVLERFIDSNERAIFLTLDVDTYPRREIRIYGLLMEAARGGKPGTIKLKRHPRGEKFSVQLVNQRPTDRWERVRRNEMLFHYGRYLGLVYFTGDPIFDQLQEPFRLAHETYASLLGMAAVVLDNGNSSHWDQVSEWLTRAEALRHEALKKKTLAELYFH